MRTDQMVIAVSGYTTNEETGQKSLTFTQCAETWYNASEIYERWRQHEPTVEPMYHYVWLN